MKVNESEFPWKPGLTLKQLIVEYKPDADVVIVNGFPQANNQWATLVLKKTDIVKLIKRGEIPSSVTMQAVLQARQGEDLTKELRKTRIGIAGCGGLGSNVALILARTGVGSLVIVDFDVIEPSNLNRQAFRITQIGMAKVGALTQELRAANPFINITSYQESITPNNATKLFQNCDVVIECLDRPEAKAMLIETLLMKLPRALLIAASGLAGSELPNNITSRQINSRLWVVGDGCSEASESQGLLAPRVWIVAGHQAAIAVRHIENKL